MKTKYFLWGILCWLLPVMGYSQSIWYNSISTKTYNYDMSKRPNIIGVWTPSNTYTEVDYIDGLGRVERSFQKNSLGDHWDLEVLREYDGAGRLLKSWLPIYSYYLGFNASPTILRDRYYEFYNDSCPYTKNVYEPSPLNRMKMQYGPGEKWRDADKAVRMDNLVNTGQDAAYRCKNYRVDTDDRLLCNSFYKASELMVERTVDEDGNQSYTFKNKSGEVLLKRQVNLTPAGEEFIDTYFVYDEAGNLRYVLTPEAIRRLSTLSVVEPDHSILKAYAYLYRYDADNRCIAKRLPGADWVWQIYDKYDRLVMVQDGRMRLENKWLYNLYDNFNRLLRQTVVVGTLQRDTIQAMFKTWTNLFPRMGNVNDLNKPFHNDMFRVADVLYTAVYGNDEYYQEEDTLALNKATCLCFDDRLPVPAIPAYFSILQRKVIQEFMNADGTMNEQLYMSTDPDDPHIRYYCLPTKLVTPMRSLLSTVEYQGGCYSMKRMPASVTVPASLVYRHSGVSSRQFLRPPDMRMRLGLGLKTDMMNTAGSIDKAYEKFCILGEDGTGGYVERTYFYDYLGRIVQTVERNRYGCINRYTNKYDYVGNLLAREEMLTTVRDTTYLRSYYTYDSGRRVTGEQVVLNGDTMASVAYAYDPAGRLCCKHYICGGVVQQDSFAYNVRNWLSYRGGSAFREQLRYESPVHHPAASFNGNISEAEWEYGEAGDVQLNGFNYDPLNRLLGNTGYIRRDSGWVVSASAFTERGISYDYNGNLLRLQRTASGALVDDLEYIYDGDRLSGVRDRVNGSPSGDVFLTAGLDTVRFEYDANGNLIKDSRHALELKYNYLNLLSEVKHNGVVVARYTWLSDGTKLCVRDGSGNNGFDYEGSLIYEKLGDELGMKCARFTDGVLLGKGASLSERVNFFYRDHLGSVRAVVDGAGRLKEQNDYYPFGARHIRSDYASSDNLFRFNGKEQQVTGNVGYLDYGARMYDAAVGRWMVQDPLSESYNGLSAYGYCGGNPVKFIDPNGMFIDEWRVDREGKITFVENDKPDRLYAVDKDGNEIASMAVKDRRIMDQLTKSVKIKDPYFKGYALSVATGDEDSQSEMLKTFLFMADHTNKEWRVDRYTEDGKTKYALGTMYHTDYSPSSERMGHSVASTVAFIHSHPDIKPAFQEEIESMGWMSDDWKGDCKNKHKNYPSTYYYTYFPNSRRLWHVGNYGAPMLIRNNITSYKGFLFGTMNTR